MSKETMDRIREAEAQADRKIADAEAQAAKWKAEAEAAGRKVCENAEKSAASDLNASLEQARNQAQALTKEALDLAAREAETISANAEQARAAAERIVIGGLEAKCR